ncbi:MAG TPA: hypothetical protein VM899_07900 [Rubellimicrobium sp.]|nr:hypothetical protein [Rubellimicrobium sp.]
MADPSLSILVIDENRARAAFALVAVCFLWMTATVRRLEAPPVPAE